MRNEYPRPDFRRDSFLSLDETWDFDFDDSNVGEKEKWFKNHDFSRKIEVPFSFQSELGGIHDLSFHDHCWYSKKFTKPCLKDEERLLLHFEGVDYDCRVFLNGVFVQENISANSGFIVDITDYLVEGENHLALHVYDPSSDRSIPRGKQDWEEESHAIFYTRTTGIYKPVWMEIVHERHIRNFFLTTTLDKYLVRIQSEVTSVGGRIEFLVTNDNDQKLYSFNVKNLSDTYSFSLPDDFVNERIWKPLHPFLFQLEISLFDEQGNKTDTVHSYFGVREVTTKDGKVLINGAPVYLKLVLNQGYYPKGVLTAPSVEDYEKDIDSMIQMGFNGCRVHQKSEDPLFLHLCDKKGFLVFQECASNYGYGIHSPRRMPNEWIDIVKTNFNHPSIIGYTPLNESWGVEGIPYDKEIQSFADSLYYLIHSLDSTRPVVGNDGWEQCKTDLITVHNYNHGNKDEKEKQARYKAALKDRKSILRYENINRFILNPGYEDEGQPILLSEFGGIAFRKDTGKKAWGYTTSTNEEEYLEDLHRIYEAIRESDCIVGICYTQLTDVEQEVNGLMTFEREFKVDPKKIKELNDSLTIK